MRVRLDSSVQCVVWSFCRPRYKNTGTDRYPAMFYATLDFSSFLIDRTLRVFCKYLSWSPGRVSSGCPVVQTRCWRPISFEAKVDVIFQSKVKEVRLSMNLIFYSVPRLKVQQDTSVNRNQICFSHAALLSVENHCHKRHTSAFGVLALI